MASHEFVTVDMQGLKAALLARARAEGRSVSAVVRGAIASALGVDGPEGVYEDHAAPIPATGTVKVSIRIDAGGARLLAMRASRACLSRGAYLQALLEDAPQGGSPARGDQLRALVASNAAMATFSRSFRQLRHLQDAVGAAQECGPTLETLGASIRSHLAVAAAVLKDIEPHNRRLRP